MTNPPPDQTPGNFSGSSPDLPDSDPRNPLDLILIGGPHNGQTLRRSDLSRPDQPVLLLSSNEDGSPSAPFFAEYRATDRIHPFFGLRIYTFIGIGIDGMSIRAGQPLAKKPRPIASSYTKKYPKK